MKYDKIKEIIEDALDIVDFADFGDGVTEEWIQKAEERLQLTFPTSYRWWLKNYGGGEINGEEIYSIYEMDFDAVVGGDIVAIHEQNKKNGYPDYMLIICETEDEIYYFDTRTEGEYSVYAYHQNILYANDFIDFLEKRIVEA